MITRRWRGEQVAIAGFCAEVFTCVARHGRHKGKLDHRFSGPEEGAAVLIVTPEGNRAWVPPREIEDTCLGGKW